MLDIFISYFFLKRRMSCWPFPPCLLCTSPSCNSYQMIRIEGADTRYSSKVISRTVSASTTLPHNRFLPPTNLEIHHIVQPKLLKSTILIITIIPPRTKMPIIAIRIPTLAPPRARQSTRLISKRRAQPRINRFMVIDAIALIVASAT